jgi:hypothetical protein
MDFQLEIFNISETLQSIQEKAETSKVRDMTSLQRSSASERIQNLRNDTTRPTMSFLVQMRDQIQSLILYQLKGSEDFSEQARSLFKKILSIWWTLYTITDQVNSANDALQVVLEIGEEIVVGFQSSSKLETSLLQAFAAGLSTFKSKMRMITGLSMKRLWPQLRPITAQSMSALEDILKLESLADRTDAILWQTEVPLEQRKAIKYSIADARSEILKSGVRGESLIEVCPNTNTTFCLA